MKLSDLIKDLQRIKRKAGDLKVSTHEGMLRSVSCQACKDGVVTIQEDANEVMIDLHCS